MDYFCDDDFLSQRSSSPLQIEDQGSDMLSEILSQRYESSSQQNLGEYLNANEIQLIKVLANHILTTNNNGSNYSPQMFLSGTKHLLNNIICKECGKNPQFFLIVLKMIKDYTMVPNYLKYQNISEFLQEYGDKFAHRNPIDLHNLFETANWMNVLFNFIAAKKNKGLVLAAVTKCVEGYQANYITGSGQKPSVDDRVYIYEREGNVVKDKRINKNENGSDSGDTKAMKVVRETKPKAPKAVKVIKTPKTPKAFRTSGSDVLSISPSIAPLSKPFQTSVQDMGKEFRESSLNIWDAMAGSNVDWEIFDAINCAKSDQSDTFPSNDPESQLLYNASTHLRTEEYNLLQPMRCWRDHSLDAMPLFVGRPNSLSISFSSIF